jgi:hypothetical protein
MVGYEGTTGRTDRSSEQIKKTQLYRIDPRKNTIGGKHLRRKLTVILKKMPSTGPVSINPTGNSTSLTTF